MPFAGPSPLARAYSRCYDQPTMIMAVFFDLYGTLAGFSPSRYKIQSQACDGAGIPLTPEGVLRGYALADAYMAEQNAVSPLRERDPEGTKRFFTEYERLVLKGADVEVAPERAWEIWQRVRQVRYGLTRFDDVLPAMDLLKQKGLALGLISNMNRTGDELAESLGLSPYLDVAVTSMEVGAEKPSPAIFRAALKGAGVEPQEAMHVGDQITSDIQGARGVGINPVLLDRDGQHRGYTGCPRIETLMELPGLLGG